MKSVLLFMLFWVSGSVWSQSPVDYTMFNATATISTSAFSTIKTTSAACTYIDVQNGVAEPLIMAVGSGSSTIPYILPPSMPQLQRVHLSIARSTAVKVKSLGSTATSGKIYFNCLQ